MRIAVLGIDLGKNVCGVVGLDASGAVVLRGAAPPQCRVVALANKLARIAWTVLRRGETFAIKASPAAAERLVDPGTRALTDR